MPPLTSDNAASVVANNSPQAAPAYGKHRAGVVAVDATMPTNQKAGINMSRFRKAHVQVVPSGGANPTVAVTWWSEGAGKFIQEQVPITKAGVGANTAFEFTVEAMNRIMFVAVTVLASGTVDVFVAGADLQTSN